MPEIVADPPDPSCYHLFPGSRIQGFQLLGPDPFSPRGRDARGRLAKGNSGNPRGRPRGIRNPRRRVPDLVARRPSAQALSDLLDSKPHLFAAARGASIAAASGHDRPGGASRDRPRIALRKAEHVQEALAAVLAAVARGEVAPAEGARIARRVCARLRAVLHLERVGRVKSGGSRG
jgi:hypothetical protein